MSRLLAAPSVEVERLTKSGVRRFDARAAVVTASVVADPAEPGTCAILHAVVRHHEPAVRPDDVLSALAVVAGLTPPVPPQVTRLAQGPLDEATGEVADPLAADRERRTDVAGG